ncbi:hypothetical protein OF117_03320 [Geodermatophilus sp. YIM 151500]|uniref:hypothetical protein n=1 Tax=Geodermatophilus sp. YIM 151500 TaxID=2984531 RepID=UPI0021E4404C|nr:hypothetical protein [Geodermatophilus sp. YIM 151500]MCV2488381.1 hypothetical protein [Geodermatophilus sp. YIM 151500]
MHQVVGAPPFDAEPVEVGVARPGERLTNPIHPADAAAACAEALGAPSGTSIEAGGPETLSREDIVRLAFRAVGREARIVHVPPALLFAAAWALRPVNPHVGEFVQFGTAAFTHDFVAPSRGRHRIGEHFRAPARA